MKYEFHVGDYVETKNGSIGRVSDAEIWYSSVIRDDVIRLSGNITRDVSCGFTPFTLNIALCDIPKYFNHIGQYDFTKINDKIKRLPKEYNDLYSKINELVEAVNQLEEKVNEMAQN